jgi:hypothetical protein
MVQGVCPLDNGIGISIATVRVVARLSWPSVLDVFHNLDLEWKQREVFLAWKRYLRVAVRVQMCSTSRRAALAVLTGAGDDTPRAR